MEKQIKLKYNYAINKKAKVLYVYEEEALGIDELKDSMKKLNVELNIVDYQQAYNHIDPVQISLYDSFLIDSCGDNSLLAKMGDIINQGINQGKTIVLINSCNFKYTQPKCKYKLPFIGGEDDYKFPQWKINVESHPLFNQVEGISAPNDDDIIKRCLVKTNQDKNSSIDIISEYHDKVPMIAIRYDLKGFIIQINYFVGDSAVMDGIDLITNALTMVKMS